MYLPERCLLASVLLYSDIESGENTERCRSCQFSPFYSAVYMLQSSQKSKKKSASRVSEDQVNNLRNIKFNAVQSEFEYIIPFNDLDQGRLQRQRAGGRMPHL